MWSQIQAWLPEITAVLRFATALIWFIIAVRAAADHRRRR